MPPAWKTRVIAGGLAIWFSIAGCLGYSRANLADDLAEYVNNPVRLLHGEMPYRDFWLLHPPGEVFVPAAVYCLGFGVNAVLLTSVGVSVLTGLAAFWIGRRIAGREVEGVLAAVVVFFAGVPAEYIGPVYLHAYLLFLLIAAGLLAEYFRDHRQRYLFFGGTAVGFAFLFRTYLTGAAGAAILLTVLLEMRARKCTWKESAWLLATCGAGILLVVAVTAALLSDLVPEMWHAIAVDSVSHAVTRRRAYGHFIAQKWVDFTPEAEDFLRAPFSPSAIFYAAVQGSDLVKTATMHAVPFLAVCCWWLRRRQRDALPAAAEWMLLFFVVWGSLTFIRAFTRGGHDHQLSQAVTPLYFVLVLQLCPILSRWRATKALGTGLIACATLGAVVGVAQRAVVVTMQRAVVASRGDSFAVAAPYGTVIFSNRECADELLGLLAAVLEQTAEKDHVFVVPWSAPAIYALTRRRNPTYYDSTIDLFYRPTDEKQQRVCEDLLSKQTRIIVGHADVPGAGWDSFGTMTRLPLLDACIDDHFERIAESGRFCVYRRRERSPD